MPHLVADLVVAGLSAPVYATSPPHDRERLFVVERGDKNQPGRIRILRLDSKELISTPFLEVADISTDFNEQGLLGLAFDPDFEHNGFFYINCTHHPDGDLTRLVTLVRRCRVSITNRDLADPHSITTVLSIPQPVPTQQFKNHKCGWLAFGPRDGFLYVGTGDGGPLSGHDPNNNAQNLGVLLGKILRIDVHGDDFPADGQRNYAIPPSNPFVGRAGALPEIWAFGLRNPWRNAFDRETGDLYIADVGQNSFEEINFQPITSKGGENYGWRTKEGAHPTPTLQPADPIPSHVVDPIHEYTHDEGIAIVGGYVYRGEQIPELQGRYLFGDLNGPIWSLHVINGVATELTNRTEELIFQPTINGLTSFGEDASGELYFMTIDGNLFAIRSK